MNWEGTSILSIERKIANIKINNYYFMKESPEFEPTGYLNGYSHSSIPIGTLKRLETLQIDLTKDEEKLLMEVHKKTRRQIMNKGGLELGYVINETPTNQDLKKFRVFYNCFAKNKKTHICNSFHIKPMKLLRDKKALVFTYMQDKHQEILCYRIYITDGIVVMNMYSASHYRMIDSPVRKRLLSRANRLLIWKSIIWFKEKGHKLYDMGGLTSDENIRKFKLGFGGEIVSVYSGYEAHSLFGKLILKIRRLKLSFVGKAQ